MIIYGEKEKLQKNFTPLSYSKLKRRKPARFTKVKLFGLLCFIGLSFFLADKAINTHLSNFQAFASPLSNSILGNFIHSQTEIETKKNEELQKVVDSTLTNSNDVYAIAIKNLKTNQSYYFNEDKSFQTASLYKLWIMAVAYKQMKEGVLKGDDEISDTVADLNAHYDISSDEAELTEGEFSFTVNDAIQQMITISHNYAALLLSDTVKIENVKTFLSSQGFNNSSVGSPPKTTAKDMELFFEKMYNGELVDANYSQKMIELLKKQELNHKLPKELPENTAIAHKTGELNDVTHDAGIVFSEKGDYIIVILSQSPIPARSEEKIASISKAVYDYFQNE